MGWQSQEYKAWSHWGVLQNAWQPSFWTRIGMNERKKVQFFTTGTPIELDSSRVLIPLIFVDLEGVKQLEWPVSYLVFQNVSVYCHWSISNRNPRQWRPRNFLICTRCPDFEVVEGPPPLSSPAKWKVRAQVSQHRQGIRWMSHEKLCCLCEQSCDAIWTQRAAPGSQTTQWFDPKWGSQGQWQTTPTQPFDEHSLSRALESFGKSPQGIDYKLDTKSENRHWAPMRGRLLLSGKTVLCCVLGSWTGTTHFFYAPTSGLSAATPWHRSW